MNKVIREIEQIKYPQQMTGNRDTIVCCVCCFLFMIKSKSEQRAREAFHRQNNSREVKTSNHLMQT